MTSDEMTCDDCEVALTDDVRSDDVERHLRSCARCRASAEVLAVAKSEPPSASERAMLASFAPRLEQAWHARRQRPSTVRQVSGYGLATLAGALAASAFFVVMTPASSPAPRPAELAAAQAELVSLPDWDTDDTAAVDESAFFEVSWPAVTEGDAP